MDSDEERLVLKSQAGDAAALDRLLRRYERPLFRHIHRLVQEDAASYDALQDTYTFLGKKRRLAEGLFWLAGLFEVGFFVMMLVFMDFGDRFHWFLFFGFLLVYSPMITFTWRNASKIDHLYYRLVDELKYGGG